LSGKQIKVPSAYAKKSTIYIDKETYMPIFQEMSDDIGVFERYEYSSLKINPAFKEDEFSEKFCRLQFLISFESNVVTFLH
jgi:outer membrane lipoprotein-sorting protein